MQKAQGPGVCKLPNLHPWDFPGKSTGVGCHWGQDKTDLLKMGPQDQGGESDRGMTGGFDSLHTPGP